MCFPGNPTMTLVLPKSAKLGSMTKRNADTTCVAQLVRMFPDENLTCARLEQAGWDGQPKCPRCGGADNVSQPASKPTDHRYGSIFDLNGDAGDMDTSKRTERFAHRVDGKRLAYRGLIPVNGNSAQAAPVQ